MATNNKGEGKKHHLEKWHGVSTVKRQAKHCSLGSFLKHHWTTAAPQEVEVHQSSFTSLTRGLSRLHVLWLIRQGNVWSVSEVVPLKIISFSYFCFVMGRGMFQDIWKLISMEHHPICATLSPAILSCCKNLEFILNSGMCTKCLFIDFSVPSY